MPPTRLFSTRSTVANLPAATSLITNWRGSIVAAFYKSLPAAILPNPPVSSTLKDTVASGLLLALELGEARVLCSRTFVPPRERLPKLDTQPILVLTVSLRRWLLAILICQRFFTISVKVFFLGVYSAAFYFYTLFMQLKSVCVTSPAKC